MDGDGDEVAKSPLPRLEDPDQQRQRCYRGNPKTFLPPRSYSYACSSAPQTSVGQNSLDEPMPYEGPRVPGTTRESDYISSLGTFWRIDIDSLNSVRWPDPLVFSDSIPVGIPKIPDVLFLPRPPPRLPPHILAYPFDKVLRRYNRLTKLVDDYQRFHGVHVFGFWTEIDLSLAASGQVPELTNALNERPAIPPYILSTRFDIVLSGAPVLSNVIDRYHTDLGLDYFAFFPTDPRNIRNLESNPEEGPDDNNTPYVK
ncbi:hypothetical protein GQX73_g9505 [Xylaria multiplex]|uniref:Uncharacterized protein n=1 Tax=Xylaria multiplex TaxID=323545 RepID=A0A7C8MGL2_9PEZI|nr:hypothetical protein GQX73_g9505 [Xylaria multiplex]